MKFTEEQLKKMNAAKTAEELIALAKAEGIEATEEEIMARFDAMHGGELADDELDNVAGGCGEHKYATWLYCDCQRDTTGHGLVKIDGYHTGSATCPYCGRTAEVESIRDLTDEVYVYQN